MRTLIFFMDVRASHGQVRVEHPKASAREIERLVAAEWASMDVEAQKPLLERALKIRKKAIEAETVGGERGGAEGVGRARLGVHQLLRPRRREAAGRRR